MRLRWMLVALAALFLHCFAWAGEPANRQNGDAIIAAKSAEIELLRGRLAGNPSSGASASLIEAENLLRQLKAAPPGKRSAISSQLDAALARVELEIDASQRDRR